MVVGRNSLFVTEEPACGGEAALTETMVSFAALRRVL